MSLKDLFSDKSANISSTNDLDLTGTLLESYDQIKAIEASQDRYISNVDFSSPANFARFGSAELYYADSFKNIYTSYPYDGSDADKKTWQNKLTDLELYLFNNIYPKSTGYVNFAPTGTAQYILLTPAISNAIPNGGKISTYFDLNLLQKPLLLSGSDGYTFEFFGKFATQTRYNTIAFLNQTNGYGKIELSGTTLRVYQSSTSPAIVHNVTLNLANLITQSNWNHYAISAINSGSSCKYNFYLNGQQVSSRTLAGPLPAYTNATMSIGAAADATANSTALTGSIDEFRVWSYGRNALEIGRNWFTNINSQQNLEIYYKFNEGIINNSSIDSNDAVILDYSGKIRNATYINYRTASRSTGSAFNDFIGIDNESADPIIKSTNQLVQDTIASYTLSGSDHDITNNKSIYKSFPSWILEEEEQENTPNLKYLTQIISSYLDDLYNKALDISDIHNNKYASGSLEPLPFYAKLLESKGFVAPDLFVNSNIIEQLLSRTDEDIYDIDIVKIKNLIYQNIYNNLLYIYKSKGTEKSIKTLLRAYGVDENLVKINVYSDDGEYKFLDTFSETAIKKKKIDFRKNNFSSTIYQKYNSSNINSLSYIPAVSSSVPYSLSYLTPYTFESELLFPKTLDITSNNYQKFYNYTSSLFGAHTAKTSSATDLSWETDDPFNFQVYSVRSDYDSSNGYILCNYKLGNVTGSLSSSYLNDLYSNSKWNLSVQITPKLDTYFAELDNGSNDYYLNGGLKYQVKLSGIKNISSEIVDTFSATSTFDASQEVTSSIQSAKRVYLGAHYNNYTGSVLAYSDIQALNFRVWADQISDSELEFHAKTLNNYGRSSPLERIENGINATRKHESLILNWNFESVSGSDANGEYFVDDSSTTIVPKSALLDGISNKYYYGFGDFFSPSSNIFIVKDYIPTTKQNMPESIQSSDMISVPNETDLVFDNLKTPNKYYISIENNMYQIISEEILNMFSGIVSFNDTIGDVKNKYSDEYASLNYLREIFFRKINNSPSLEKYLEFYKWLDSSLGIMLEQLIPSTTRYNKGLSNVVESHILERNKYGYRKPLLSTRYINPNQPIRGREQLKISWNPTLAANAQSEHAAVRTDTDDKTYTIESTIGISTSDAVRPVSINNSVLLSGSVTGSYIYDDSQIIKNNNRKIGNYRFSYDLVQTTGRSANNKNLVNNRGDITLSKKTNKNIFANTFASPATSQNAMLISGTFTPSTDSESGEYSAYSTVNYRNLNARNYLRTWLAQTSSALTNITQSYHRTNKNPYYRYTYANPTTTSSYTSSINYDNAFVEHQIPRSDLGYAWIRESLAIFPSQSVYTSKFPNLNSNLTFFTSSFLNKTTHQLTQSGNWNLLANNRDGQKSRSLSKNNRIEYLNNSGDVASAVEPAIEWNYPIRHTINVQSASRDTEVLSAFNNIKDNFTSYNLKDAIGLFKNTNTGYEQFRKLEKDGNSSLEIKQIEFREPLFPRKQKVGLFDIRYRNIDNEVLGIASLGRNPAFITKFWDSDINKRVRNAVSGSSGWVYSDDYSLLNYRNSLISNSAGDSVLYTATGNFYSITASVGNRLSSINLLDNDAAITGSVNIYIKDITPRFSSSITTFIKGELADFDLFEKRNMVYQQSITTSSIDTLDKTEKYAIYSSKDYRVKPRAFVNNTIIYNSDFSGTAPIHGEIYLYNAGYVYVADKISGKTPSYNSYYEFLNDIKPISKNYSLIPEYRVEDHMDSFISNSYNYTKYSDIYVTGNYLSLNGREDNYGNSSLNLSTNINNINIIKNPTKKIKFKANVIKKLLPYNGFYPQQRSAQIIQKFQKAFFELSDSIVTGSNKISETPSAFKNYTSQIGSDTPLDQQIQTILQPFFAPGLLFNAFKSGMSLSQPIYSAFPTGSLTTNSPFYNNSDSSLASIYADPAYIGTARTANVPLLLRAPTETWIFTDLLNPFDKIFINNTTEEQLSSSAIYYMAPDASSISLISNGANVSYPSFTRKNLTNDIYSISAKSAYYYYSINNFLSEIPNFFLDKNQITSYISKPESEFSTFISGTAYYMDLILKRDTGIKSSLDTSFEVYQGNLKWNGKLTEGSTYGFSYDCRSSVSSSMYSEASYAPCAPPYIYGEARLRIVFIPKETRKYSLKEIQQGCKFTNINIDLYRALYSITNYPKDNTSFANRMLLEKCFNVLGKTKLSTTSYDQIGNPISITEKDDFAWSIQPYFECPILNFETPENREYAITSSIASSGSYSINKITSVGLWTGYGAIPNNSGVNINLAESYTGLENTGSLINACGFVPEVKKLGTIANEKEISEGILLLPHRPKPKPAPDKLDDFELFSVDVNIIDSLLGVKFAEIKDTVQLEKILNNPNINKENSIIKTMKNMLKYNIPYHLDWIRNPALKQKPFVLYILEVNHTLDQQDLADIWQGLLPKIGTVAELDEVEIEHELLENEFFHGQEIPKDIKFKTFKVKKKANINYYEMTEDSVDDKRFKFKFLNNKNSLKYSYNWPYDHFSLAELVNIEAGFSYSGSMK